MTDNSLFHYLNNLTRDFLTEKYREHNPGITLSITDTGIKIMLEAASAAKDIRIQVEVNIAYDVELIPCERTPTHPHSFKLKGYQLRTYRESDDDRDETVTRTREDGAQFFLPNLPFLPPPTKPPA